MAPSRRTLALTATLAAAGVAAVAARRADARWAAAEDPCRPEERLLPAGEARTVITDDGAELAVTDAGAGPTIVLAHGWTNARELWAPVAHRLLRSGHRVVLYDQRGHGSSTVGSDGFTIARLGADLAAVLEQLDLRGAVLAGHSMGGMTIQALASHHLDVLDERATAIVLVSTAASGLSQGTRDATAATVVASPRLARALASPVGHALVRGSLGKMVCRNHLVLTRDQFLACPPETRAGLLTAMQAMDLREGIAAIGVPVTILVGPHDRLTPPGRAAELADVIPGAELVTLDGFGHMLPIEAPDQVAAAIEAAAMEAASAA
ncbi:MAG TPA: alpha/beta fold hydrolase [Acidimicrobiales bacterium]|nr:alpha/beta fold hydrolase [Acidimicrobiales bacterium]